MSLEHSPARQGKRAAYSLNEFCEDHRISRSMLYKLWAAGIGPRSPSLLSRSQRRLRNHSPREGRAG